MFLVKFQCKVSVLHCWSMLWITGAYPWGVVLDSSLTFDQRVLNTVRNCNFHLRALRHIRRRSSIPEKHIKAVWTTSICAFFHDGPANGSSHWHFIWSPSLFCGWTTNLERITTWATTVQHTSVFQVSLEDILLPPSHGQLAPHSQVAPPIAFLMTKLARAK